MTDARARAARWVLVVLAIMAGVLPGASRPGAAERPEPELLCGKVQLSGTAGQRLAVMTDDGHQLLVDTSRAGGYPARALEPGERVILIGEPAAGPRRFVAREVLLETWRPGPGEGPWRCLHGRVLESDPEQFRLRTAGGSVVTVDRREARRDVTNLFRGQAVTVVGPMEEVSPVRLTGRFILAADERLPWPGR